MPTVITTPGSPTANSYCSVAEGDAYHATRLNVADWTGASTTTKETALIGATRLMDTAWTWWARSTNLGQVLQWPRVGLVDVLYLQQLDQNTIPQRLKEATAEFARNLIIGDRTLDNDVETQRLKSLKAGSVSLDFDVESVVAKVVPDSVFNMIPEWWGYTNDRGGTRPLMRT